jgi:hypothetical protein
MMTPDERFALAKQRWYELAVRHSSMADMLCNASPPYCDGAYFHAYHAYECMVTAILASAKMPYTREAWQYDPATHTYYYFDYHGNRLDDRGEHYVYLMLARQIIGTTKPYSAAFDALAKHKPNHRNQAIDYRFGYLKLPHDQAPYRCEAVRHYVRQVQQFIEEVWRDLSPPPTPGTSAASPLPAGSP